MHQLGVAHIDLRFRNILVSTSTGAIVVFDFAICRPSRSAGPQDSEHPEFQIGVEDDRLTILDMVQRICGDTFPGGKCSRDHINATKGGLTRWLSANYSTEPWFHHFQLARLFALYAITDQSESSKCIA